MRRGPAIVFVAFLLSLSATTASARDPLKIDNSDNSNRYKYPPQSYDDIKPVLDDINFYNSKVQCGGWQNMSAEGTIATVTGVPGHTTKWNGNLTSGMGMRTDATGRNTDFQFPSAAAGLITSCNPGQNTIPKVIWTPDPDHPGMVIQKVFTLPHPEFYDPSCRWRRQDTNGKYVATAPGYPDALHPIETYMPPPAYGEMQKPEDGVLDGNGNVQIPGDRQSPGNCVTFCQYLNTFQYVDCLKLAAPSYIQPNVCLLWGRKYLCTDQAVVNPGSACNVGQQTATEPANARACAGSSCRCMIDGKSKTPSCLSNPGSGWAEAPAFYSYYRQYLGSFTRKTIATDHDGQQQSGLPNDDATRNNVPVACYGFYNEFDPMTHQTQPQDRRCLIDIDVSNMRKSQLGKGEYGQSSSMMDPDPEASGNQRAAGGKAGNGGNLWFTKLGSAFSLLDEATFQNTTYNQDLTNVFLGTDTLDNASVTTSWPIAFQGENPHTASGDFLRSFDDSGDKRVIANWWQKQATYVATIVHPINVRLLLPPGFAFGADATNPIFTQSQSVSSSDIDIRSQRMEVQIGAGEDTLSEVIDAIQKSLLLHLEEEPIHVAVAFGDPTDFRAKAVAWCSWYIKQSNDTTCDNAPTNIRNYINGLNAYADDIEKVRVLRTDLAKYAGALLNLEQKLTDPIGRWMDNNLTKYRVFLFRQQVIAQQDISAWAVAEQAMSKFHDDADMPWCMNQRFEGPIFSLLDPWLPSRNVGGRIGGDNLPDLGSVIPFPGEDPVDTPTPPQDILLDFSHIAYLNKALKVPVFDPVQIMATVPAPDDAMKIGDFALTLPALPSLDPIQTAVQTSLNALPKVQSGSMTGGTGFPDLQLPPIDQTGALERLATINQITFVVRNMTDIYDTFWKSIGPLKPQTQDTPYDPSKKCNDEMLKNKKENGQCCGFNDGVCEHVEMDLIERFQRIGSRKMVLLTEDYQSVGLAKRSPDTCVPSDQTCYILHGESPLPRFQLQVKPPSKVPDIIGPVRQGVWQTTMPQPIGKMDARSAPYPTDDLVPLQEGPPTLDLSIPPPSS